MLLRCFCITRLVTLLSENDTMVRMIFALVAICVVIVVAFAMFRQKPVAEVQPDASLKAEERKETMKDETLQKPEIIIDESKTYLAVLHTSEGDVTIELNSQATPITVNNFVSLARKNFYDGTVFHRVIEGFMIQGGDPTGTGTGGPGYKFDDEPFEGNYTRGTVAMANAGPNTNGSQFFIMHADYPLPKNYVIFGKVSEGLEVVDKIATAETSVSLGGEKSKPISPVSINSVDIIER